MKHCESRSLISPMARKRASPVSDRLLFLSSPFPSVKLGQLVGVGAQAESCLKCVNCTSGDEVCEFEFSIEQNERNKSARRNAG